MPHSGAVRCRFINTSRMINWPWGFKQRWSLISSALVYTDTVGVQDIGDKYGVESFG